MKTFQYKIALVAIVLLPVLSFAQEIRTKEVKKQYTVSSNATLAIDGKYGDVHIETWDQNKVDVQVSIEVTNRSAAKAQSNLDMISIAIIDSDADNLSFKTNIDGNINNNNGDKIEIEYRVKVPKSINLNLKNSYGHLYLQDINGRVSIDVAYGNFKVGTLAAPVDILLSYGNGQIESIADGAVNVRYSNLDIENAGNVEVSNSYSNIDFGTSQDIDLVNKYGNITWRKVDKLEGYSKYGNVKIDQLYKALDFEVMYGGGIKIDWISKTFTSINVESSYAAVALNFEKGMSAMLEAEMKYSDLKNYNIEFDYSFLDESGSVKEYKGKLGKGTFSSKITVTSEYGNVKIGYVD